MIDEKKLIEELNRQKYILTFEDSNPIDEGFNCGIDKAIQLVESQPKVGEWIPVEERLPEEQTDYKGIKRSYCSLVTVIGYGVSRIDIDYTVNGIWHLEEANTVLKVLAWQPLPKSYEVKE